MLRRCVAGVNARDRAHDHKSIIIKTRWETQILRRCVAGANARDGGHDHKSIIIKTRWETQNVAAAPCRRKCPRREPQS